VRRLSVVAIVAIALSEAAGVVRRSDPAVAVAAEPAPGTEAKRAVGPAEQPLGPGDVPPASLAAGARRPAPPALLVEIPRVMTLTARPGGGRVVGSMPTGSRYYGQPMVAWVLETTADGRFGRVPIPYGGRDATGWLRLRGLETDTTHIRVVVDLSRHRLEVHRGSRVLLRAPAGTGTPVSPTPPGSYFVTDRVAFPGGGSLGTFAFGVSGIQTRLPPGWVGGDQLAIHGTDAPATIGTSSSAGCLRVGEGTLDRLRRLLYPGTPVIVLR
jgi:lipoprotein-anchoring transpeptidase ErfK/SrfK